MANWLAGLAVGTIVGVRGVWRADNGSGTPDVRLFTSSDGGATWTLRGTTTGGTVPTTVTAPSQPIVWAGSHASVDSLLTRAVLLRNGSEVAAWSADTARGPRDSDSYGNVWTLNGSAYAWKVL